MRTSAAYVLLASPAYVTLIPFDDLDSFSILTTIS